MNEVRRGGPIGVAEDVAALTRFGSAEEIRTFVGVATSSSWWAGQGWPTEVRVDFTSPKLHPRRARGGWTPQRGWYVRFPGCDGLPDAPPWTALVVCHELAHLTIQADGDARYKAHGARFCERYLDLVAHLVDDHQADVLASCLAEHGVRAA